MQQKSGWFDGIDRFFHRRATESSENGIGVLAVTVSRADSDLLETTVRAAGWKLAIASDCESASATLRNREFPVVLYDRDLPHRNWRECMPPLLDVPRPPCIILASAVNDSYLWHEVVQLGGYDVISKPLRPEQIVAAVRRAWLFWNATHSSTLR